MGRAIVFARKIGSKSMILAKDESKEEKEKILNVISYEHSSLGFFQYILFILVHDMFYSMGHASYNKFTPILSTDQFEKLVDKYIRDFRQETIDLLYRQDIRPRIVMIDGYNGHVTLFKFNEHSGFMWQRCHIKNGTFDRCENEEQIAWIKRRKFF